MNFLKYQNLPNRNKEISLISDPRINVLQNLYSQTNDELWIESWLQQNCIYRSIPKVKVNKPNNQISISEARALLKTCLQTIEKISRAQRDLQNNVDRFTSAEWKQKTVEIGVLKDHFSKMISKFENGDVMKKLRTTLKKRKVKRLKQKKRKEFKQNLRKERLMNRENLHKSIDQWLQNKKEEVEKVKMEEDMKKDADCVLSEVTKKKSDARKQLSLIASLSKLRNVRDQIATYRGEKMSLEDRSAFNITVEKLIKMWEDALNTYTKEEQGLKLMLEKSADSESTRLAKERKLLEEWRTILFGPKVVVPQENYMYWALTAAERDMETFVAIRKSWDTFLVPPTHELGSKIPIGWVLPDSSPNKSWAKYLSTVF